MDHSDPLRIPGVTNPVESTHYPVPLLYRYRDAGMSQQARGLVDSLGILAIILVYTPRSIPVSRTARQMHANSLRDGQ